MTTFKDVFADIWGITALRTLVLHKLHRTLITYTLYAARRNDIVDLVRYAYSGEHTLDSTRGHDEFRSLVIHFIVCEVTGMLQSTEFMSLIEEGGSFSRDLLQVVSRTSLF